MSKPINHPAMICMYTNTEIHTLSSLTARTACDWFGWARVWFIPSSGHIWCGLHYTPLGQSFLCRSRGVSKLSYNTAHNEGRRGVCFVFFCFLLRRRPYAHPRTTLAREVPIDHRLYCLQPCVCAWSMHIWAGKRVWVSTYKGQTLSMAHLWWNLIWQIGSMMGGGTSNCV